IEWQADDEDTLDRFDKILELAAELEIAEIDAATLREHLEARATLAKHACTFEDVPHALRLIDLLGDLPGPAWNWADAETQIEARRTRLAAGTPPDEVDTFLARHRRLAALSFEEVTAEGLVAALAQAGATGDRRDAILQELVAQAGRALDRTDLEAA